MENKETYKSISGHSLENLKLYHQQATDFFATELMMLNDVIKQITDERQSKASLLLVSCTQTGAALLQLANQTDYFTSESIMLSRAFMEKITNFCYVNICDESEYRAFLLHPIYKHYHYVGSIKLDEDIDLSRLDDSQKLRETKQQKLKSIPIVQEALEIFSDTNSRMNWTKKNLNQRIDIIKKRGKLLDVFFTLSKIQYYSDASEALHGSLYGCGYGIGAFDPEFNTHDEEELKKKLHKDSACNLLHLGMLIHETFTLINYSTDINSIWEESYYNRGLALNLQFHILERKIPRKN